MKKLVFITDSGFWSHDTKIVSELNKFYSLTLLITYVDGFLNHDTNDIESFCKINNIKLEIVIKESLRSRNPINIFKNYTKYIKTIKKINPDIIYIESFANPYLTIMYYIFFSTRKIVIGVHDFKLHPIENNKTKFSARIYKYLFTKLFNNFHFFSESQKVFFSKRFPDKKVFVAKLFNLDIKENINHSKSQHSNITFLYFGRIFYYKGIDILIEAANILNEKEINFKLIIAGHCTDFDYYRKKIKYNKNIVLKIQRIPSEEITNLFKEADYFVAPYREVTQSGPLVLSYNYDMIPIASNLDGFNEYISNNKTGFLFESENYKSLASIMEKVLSLDDISKNKIKNNIKIFKNDEFSIHKLTEKYRMFFDSL